MLLHLAGNKLDLVEYINEYIALHFSGGYRIDVFNRLSISITQPTFTVKTIERTDAAWSIFSELGDHIHIFMDGDSYNGPESFVMAGPGFVIVEQ